MLLDRIEPASETADILIVGAGAVGLTMGIALARAGKRVLLCEAGQARLDPEWQAHNHVVQGGRHHLGSLDGRYRGLGGTTRLWGGQLMPFTTADLAPNPDLGKPGWPYDCAVRTVMRLLLPDRRQSLPAAQLRQRDCYCELLPLAEGGGTCDDP